MLKDNDKVTYSVEAKQADCPNEVNAWTSTTDGETHHNGSLSPRWGPGDLTVTTKPADGMGVPLMNDAFVVVLADKVKGQPSEIINVDLYIKNAAFAQYETDRLPATGTPSPTGFTIEVGEPEANVYVGKTGLFVGTICVGDLDFMPS